MAGEAAGVVGDVAVQVSLVSVVFPIKRETHVAIAGGSGWTVKKVKVGTVKGKRGRGRDKNLPVR